MSSYTSKDTQYEVINSEEVLRDKDNFEKSFNEFEKKGWEFIAFDLQWGFYIFKR